MKTNKLFGAFFIVMISMLISSVTGLGALAVGSGLVLTSWMPKPKNVVMMALDVEVWKPWIVDTLFKNNEFLNFARNADEYVLMGKVVHIPNSGAASSIVRNRSSLPATVTQRTDVDITYSLDEFTSDPRLLQLTEGQVISYNKMDSMMGQDMRAVRQLVAEWMLYHWAASSSSYIVRTTGGNVTAHLSTATGNRKIILLADIENAAAILDGADVPDDGNRYLAIDAQMHKQLRSQMTPTDYKDFSSAYDPKTNVIGELFGFKFVKRSTVLRYDNSGTPAVKSPAATEATADNAGVLCWHSDWVERAIGTTEIFEDTRNPLYYGDIYSLLVRAGGRKVEQNGLGVVSIVQAAGT